MTDPVADVDKVGVRDALVEQAHAELRALAGAISSDQSAASLAESDSHQVDDLSQSDEAGDLAGLTSDAVVRLRRQIDALERLDFGPKDVVTPGAIVGIDALRYVVGVVAPPVESAGISYEGIADDSPLYQCIVGLRAGDTFTFRGVSRKVDFVA